jgi:hypothetical protein
MNKWWLSVCYGVECQENGKYWGVHSLLNFLYYSIFPEGSPMFTAVSLFFES